MTSYAVRRDDGSWWNGAGWTTLAAFSQRYESMSAAVCSLMLADQDGEDWRVVAV